MRPSNSSPPNAATGADPGTFQHVPVISVSTIPSTNDGDCVSLPRASTPATMFSRNMHTCTPATMAKDLPCIDQTSLFSYPHDYFICMKLETSPKKVRRFFLNFCRFGRSSVLERLLELVRLWKATASLDFTVGFCCFSSNSWTSL